MFANGSTTILTLVIFRGKGKHIKQEERQAWDIPVTVNVQDKIPEAAGSHGQICLPTWTQLKKQKISRCNNVLIETHLYMCSCEASFRIQQLDVVMKIVNENLQTNIVSLLPLRQ